ncbi:MAG: 3-phosphoshikimate 1-carboxyvinyltransferase [Pelagibacterales bacterium MED-G43]|nr:MAG: 3-phosphoshikimate 1-carboxyvinyltransferase [Pelagibacterales bacterium MED-G43]|tara:strand:+ start:2960 stop:4309 length:1350 start_codon:yes stop_codon:yes gene_type:complete
MSKRSFKLVLNNKISTFKKTIRVDSDKSISIRSFLIGAISQDISIVNNILESEDVLSTIECLKKLGVKIKKIKSQKYLIYGKGLGSFFLKKNKKLNFGNSGTLARLLIGILSTTPRISAKLEGDHSLNKRSMKSLIKLMNKFGAHFSPKNKFNFPLKFTSSETPIGIDYKAGVSAQLKSAVILAGLNSYGATKIIEHHRSRDHTENMLVNNSEIIKIKNMKKKEIIIFGKKYLNPIKIIIPSDPSSSAFFSALTLLNKDSSLIIKNVGLNPTRTGFYQLLKKQGANIKFKNLKKNNNELSGDIIVRSSNLKPLNASKSYYTNMTDEYPVLFIMAGLIKGTSTFKGINDLTNKESNRILEMQKILKQVNIKSKYLKGELKIFGRGLFDASNKTIKVPNLGDHRICMSSFILGLLTGAKTSISNFETVFTSSPSFLKIMKKNLGVKFEIKR